MANNEVTVKGGAHYRAQKKANRELCEEATAAWRALSPVEQVLELDKRFGKGVGASKQRARLAKALLKAN